MAARRPARRTIRRTRVCAPRSIWACRPRWPQLAAAHLAAWRPRRRAAGRGHGGAARQQRGAGGRGLGRLSTARPAGRSISAPCMRSPGSTLKPFLYARALDRGLLAAGGRARRPARGRAAASATPTTRFLGPLLPRQALANSRNVPAANLLRRIGLRRRVRLSCATSGCTRWTGRPTGSGWRWRSARCRPAWTGWWAPTPPWPMTAWRRELVWLDGQRRGDAAPADLGRCGAAGDAVPQRPDGPAAQFPALRRQRIPVRGGAEDRHLAGLPRCLDGGLVAGLPGGRLGRARRCRADDAAQRRPRRRAAGAGGDAASARRQPHRSAGRRVRRPARARAGRAVHRHRRAARRPPAPDG